MSDRVFVVRPKVLRLRQGPSTHTTVLTRLQQGQMVARLDLKDRHGWWRVFADTPHAGAYVGYVSATYVDHWSMDPGLVTPAPAHAQAPAPPQSTPDMRQPPASAPSAALTAPPPPAPVSEAAFARSSEDIAPGAGVGPDGGRGPDVAPGLGVNRGEAASSSVWAEAHIHSPHASRDAHQPAAHRLDDPSAPRRDAYSSSEDQVHALQSIANWLAPEHSRRYWRSETGHVGAGRTRCNVYAYDFACLAGGYLPRVWWTDDALERITAGQTVGAVYGQTVGELTANALFRWFATYSSYYGWRAEPSLDALQHHANAGGLAVIVARHVVESSSGHIAMVMPEGSADVSGEPWTARRDGGGVLIPVCSQAGADLYRVGRPSTQWWSSQSMAEYGFWVHD